MAIRLLHCTAEELEGAVSLRHTHPNKSFLDAINQGVFNGIDDKFVATNERIDILAEDSHTHANKPTLDKFSETGGQLLFDGRPVGEVAPIETRFERIIPIKIYSFMGFSADNNFALTAAGLLDINEGHTISLPDYPRALSPSGELVLFYNTPNIFTVYNIETEESRTFIHDTTGGSFSVTNMCFMPDGQHILTQRNEEIKIWRLDTLEEVKEFDIQSSFINYFGVFSPNGRFMATAFYESPMGGQGYLTLYNFTDVMDIIPSGGWAATASLSIPLIDDYCASAYTADGEIRITIIADGAEQSRPFLFNPKDALGADIIYASINHVFAIYTDWDVNTVIKCYGLTREPMAAEFGYELQWQKYITGYPSTGLTTNDYFIFSYNDDITFIYTMDGKTVWHRDFIDTPIAHQSRDGSLLALSNGIYRRIIHNESED